MSDPGCPVRGKDELCELELIPINVIHQGRAIASYDYIRACRLHADPFDGWPNEVLHHHDNTPCPGTMDADPWPHCERRKVVRRGHRFSIRSGNNSIWIGKKPLDLDRRKIERRRGQ
jgi:hypothetical protein